MMLRCELESELVAIVVQPDQINRRFFPYWLTLMGHVHHSIDNKRPVQSSVTISIRRLAYVPSRI